MNCQSDAREVVVDYIGFSLPFVFMDDYRSLCSDNLPEFGDISAAVVFVLYAVIIFYQKFVDPYGRIHLR